MEPLVECKVNEGVTMLATPVEELMSEEEVMLTEEVPVTVLETETEPVEAVSSTVAPEMVLAVREPAETLKSP